MVFILMLACMLTPIYHSLDSRGPCATHLEFLHDRRDGPIVIGISASFSEGDWSSR